MQALTGLGELGFTFAKADGGDFGRRQRSNDTHRCVARGTGLFAGRRDGFFRCTNRDIPELEPRHRRWRHSTANARSGFLLRHDRQLHDPTGCWCGLSDHEVASHEGRHAINVDRAAELRGMHAHPSVRPQDHPSVPTADEKSRRAQLRSMLPEAPKGLGIDGDERGGTLRRRGICG